MIRSWNGITELAPDNIACLGGFPGLPGLNIFCASNDTAFCLSPAVGYTLAELASGEKTTVDISAWDPARFEYLDGFIRYPYVAEE